MSVQSHPKIDVLREHARGEHDKALRLDCPACRMYLRKPKRRAS